MPSRKARAQDHLRLIPVKKRVSVPSGCPGRVKQQHEILLVRFRSFGIRSHVNQSQFWVWLSVSPQIHR